MSADPTLHKVRQLIGMTGSSNLEEARSMALAACHMILKHNLVLSLPPDAPKPASVSPNDHDFPFSPTVQRVSPTHPFRPEPETSSRVPRPRASSKKDPGLAREVSKLVSKYPGSCKKCGFAYKSGDTIYWRRDHGATHVRCGAKALGG
jgi:hypothetical protein